MPLVPQSLLALAIGVTVFAAGAGTTVSAQVKSTLVMASTAAASSHYAAAVAMSRAIKDENPAVAVTVLETGATVDNLRRMSRGEADLGLASSDVAIMAREGLEQFEGKAISDLVVLYSYDRNAINVTVRADSGVDKLADLEGKKLSGGIRGSAVALLARSMMDLFGIHPDWVGGSLNDAMAAIQNRQIAGYVKSSSVGAVDATLRELNTSTQMRIIGFTPEQETLVLSKIRGIGFTTLPENLIPGQKAVRVPSIQGIYVTRTSLMNDDTAFAIAKAIYERREYLLEVFPHLRNDFNFKEQALLNETIGLKIHPGAKRFWESVK